MGATCRAPFTAFLTPILVFLRFPILPSLPLFPTIPLASLSLPCSLPPSLSPSLPPSLPPARAALALTRALPCAEHRNTCERLDVKSYPTLFWFAAAAGAPTVYTGPRSADAIRAFIIDEAAGDSEEALSLWASYVKGMLSNLGRLPLERIHNTLVLFASMGDHPFRKPQQDTARVLAALCRDGVVSLADGLYSIA